METVTPNGPLATAVEPAAELKPTLTAPTKVPPKHHTASIFLGPDQVLPAAFATAVGDLEKALEMPIWLVVQSAEGKFDGLNWELVEAFLSAKSELKEKEPIALLIQTHQVM